MKIHRNFLQNFHIISLLYRGIYCAVVFYLSVSGCSNIDQQNELTREYIHQQHNFKINYSDHWIIKEIPVIIYPDKRSTKILFCDSLMQENCSIAIYSSNDEGMIRESYNIISEKERLLNGYRANCINGFDHKNKDVFIEIKLIHHNSRLYVFKGKGHIWDKMIDTFEILSDNQNSNVK